MSARNSRFAALIAGVSSLAAAGLAGAAIVPIQLTAGSYNQDVVVEAAATQGAAGSIYSANVTATLDGNTNKNGATWFERGLAGHTTTASWGLPAAGVPIVSGADANTTFTLAPFTGNNAVLLTAGQSATLTLTTPRYYNALAFFASTGGGSGSGALTLNFADGFPSVTGLSYNAPDWFGGANAALTGLDRVTATSGNFDGNTDNPRVYQSTLALPAAATAHPISSIGITYSGNGNSALLAVSGQVPEPASLGTLAFAALGLFAHRRPRHA